MFGIRYAKFPPGFHVFKYSKGKLVAAGDALSFSFFAPFTSIVVVKTGSSDAHFMFSEITVDFQEITIQGQFTYKIVDPVKTAEMLNHTINNITHRYISDDPSKLEERLINLALVAAKSAVRLLPLKDAVVASDAIAKAILSTLSNDKMVAALGVEVLSVTVAAVKPNAETARALEAQTREQILKESDDAVFLRRNSAVEKERTIRENELNTEIAVENKNREIRVKQMESQILVQQKQQEMEESRQAFTIQSEEKNKALVELKAANQRKEADTKAYAVTAILKAYEGASAELLQLLANSNMDSGRLMALAFQNMADKADKIGNLNITPDLLNNIMDFDGPAKPTKR
ncbi:MAG: hypothetical protein LBV04_04030 [Deferribacteraceae bacterium]|jgi:hypothetical protein|nr:hypothetical protein [Deferribacteraceae bacterium]